MKLSLKRLTLATCLSAALLSSSVMIPGEVSAADFTTKYRVYQNEQILKEFHDYKQAVNYADDFLNSHVELISDRSWVWDNFPRYRVYQYEKTLPAWGFDTLAEAQAEARKWANSSVRDLQSGGWVWHNYKDDATAPYRLYQGEKTLDQWSFNTLEAAQKEGNKWAKSYIIDTNTNQLIWNNYKAETIEKARASDPVYEVYIPYVYGEVKYYSYIGDAIHEAAKTAEAVVKNINKNEIIYQNTAAYKVYQNGKFLRQYNQLDAALNYAKKWKHATITKKNRDIWSNYPYYQVYQGDRVIGEYHTIPEALSYAQQFAQASIQTYGTNGVIWNNYRKLQYWGWSGTTRNNSVYDQISQTQGLDVSSPTWFELVDAKGTLKDLSDPELAKWLKNQGKQVYPLVHNQFDSKLTTQFLNNTKAVDDFIEAIVKRSVELGVTGINMDFESLSGKDRAAFTSFMQKLTDSAHAKGLKISIDLPRGSASWNHLTAFDHEKLAKIVDYIITMTYDHHYSGSPTPGPVAGMSWVEGGIQEFLAYGIERDKLILGIPFYVREWKVDAQGKLVSNRAITVRNIPELMRTKQTTSTWDSKFEQYKVEYKEDGHTYVFWLEDEASIERRLELAKKYDLGGVAIWRLGYDTKELWTMMVQNK
jgi:spore germination protein YaaH